MIAAELETPNLFVRFKLPFQSLSAIRAQRDRGPMLDHTLEVEDTPTRIVALPLEGTKLALALMRDLVNAQKSGRSKRIEKVRKRLDKALAALASAR